MPVEGSYEARLGRFQSDLDRLIRRLRTLSSNGWRPREATVRKLAQDLADLSAPLEESANREVPALPVFGLADAIAVLGSDLAQLLDDHELENSLAQASALVAAALSGTA